MDKDCLGCRGGSIHHTCGRTPEASTVTKDSPCTDAEAHITTPRDQPCPSCGLYGSDPRCDHPDEEVADGYCWGCGMDLGR